MKVLVAFASKHGSTKGIADFIGEKLRQNGADVDVLDVNKVRDLRFYGAFVIGSALYFGHWMKDAKQFVSRNRDILSARPVWLFSSGPTGKERKDAKGRDLLDTSVSGPFEIEDLKQGLQVKDHRVFFGVYDEKSLGFFTRQLMKSSAIREAVPIGDFRDWKEIESWSVSIMQSLKEETLAR